MKKYFVLWAALLPLATQAAALSCKHFEYEDLAPERDAVLKKYENRDVEKLSAKESAEFNQAMMLSAKTVCTFSGSLNDAFATFRMDKKFGLGRSAAKFTKTLPAKNYQKSVQSKEDTEKWKITRKGKQVILDKMVEDDVGYSASTTTFTPNGKIVHIERRFYLP